MSDNLQGNFLPTTQVWDVSQIESTDVTSPEFKELIVRLYQNLNNHAMAVNAKDTGSYDTQEFVNGQTFFASSGSDSSTSSNEGRQVFRKVINFGSLPNNTTKTVAHDVSISDDVSFTRIYGTTNDKIAHSYLALPYATSTAADIIELYVDGTNVAIKTGKDRTSYTVTYVILEYLKQ